MDAASFWSVAGRMGLRDVAQARYSTDNLTAAQLHTMRCVAANGVALSKCQVLAKADVQISTAESRGLVARRPSRRLL
jgi:hypothetical protein